MRIQKTQLGVTTKIASGGQGEVLEAPRVRLNQALRAVFKQYKPEVLVNCDFQALDVMSGYAETLSFAEGSELFGIAAWPVSVVEDGGSPVGFIMPVIPDDFALDLRMPSGGTQRVIAEFQHLLNSRAWLSKRGIAVSDRQRYELIAAAADGVRFLHRHDIVVGDFSAKNLLFSLQPSVQVFFVDCDAMVFRGRSVGPQMETPGWDVESLGEAKATKASDTYKLGLLALRLLVGDQFTRSPDALPRGVDPAVRDFIERSLTAKPASRPSPGVLSSAARAAGSKAPASPSVVTTPTNTTSPPQPIPIPVVPVAAPASTPRVISAGGASGGGAVSVGSSFSLARDSGFRATCIATALALVGVLTLGWAESDVLWAAPGAGLLVGIGAFQRLARVGSAARAIHWFALAAALALVVAVRHSSIDLDPRDVNTLAVAAVPVVQATSLLTERRWKPALTQSVAVLLLLVAANFYLGAVSASDVSKWLDKASDDATASSGAANALLDPGGVILPGQFLTDPSGAFRLVLQGDGNLVLYDGGGNAIWFSGTNGQPVAAGHMQADGNFVLYSVDGIAVWSTGTQGHLGGALAVLPDGRVVVQVGTTVVWST